MTREEQIDWLCRLRAYLNNGIIITPWNKEFTEALNKALEQEPCEDAISRQAAIRWVKTVCNPYGKPTLDFESGKKVIKHLEQMSPVTPQSKIGHCRDCKHWKDNDGVYRRGIGAESGCPINRKEVYEGNGYCFLFEKKESEE